MAADSYRSAIAHLSQASPYMTRLIQVVGPPTIEVKRAASPFASLARSITYQQLAGKAAMTIWGRVETTVGGKRGLRPDVFLKTPVEKLRAAGLSQNKTAAILDLATKASAGVVPTWRDLEALNDDAIIERLCQVRGIGPWTVQMMLIFSLGRTDVWPSTDLGVQKGFQITFRKRAVPNAKHLHTAGDLFRPYRSLAAWYLWRANEVAETLRLRTPKDSD